MGFVQVVNSKFGWTNKEYYGISASGNYAITY